jgi:CRP-like cAMP-binding protein
VDAETPFRPECQSLVRKLEGLADLTPAARAAILDLKMVTRSIAADQDIVSIGDLPTECCFILEGYAFRYKVLSGGGRQIMSLHLAGDMPDLQSLHVGRMDYSLATLVPTRAAIIQNSDLLELMRRHESIWMALWRDSLIDSAIFREWLVSASRRTAHQRVAHRFCEVAVRTQAVGLSAGSTYPWPFTQSELADAVGLTDVHVNRVLRDIRQDGLLTVGRGTFSVLDWRALRALGQFDPSYLRLETRPVA